MRILTKEDLEKKLLIELQKSTQRKGNIKKKDRILII